MKCLSVTSCSVSVQVYALTPAQMITINNTTSFAKKLCEGAGIHAENRFIISHYPVYLLCFPHP